MSKESTAPQSSQPQPTPAAPKADEKNVEAQPLPPIRQEVEMIVNSEKFRRRTGTSELRE